MPDKPIIHGSMIKRINEAHARAMAGMRTACAAAVDVGTLLEEAKAAIPHGKWAAWVDEHCDFGDRQARRYIKIARDVNGLPDIKSDMPVSVLPMRELANMANDIEQAKPAESMEIDESEPEPDAEPDEILEIVKPSVSQSRTLERLPEPLRQEAWNRISVDRAPLDDDGKVKITVALCNEVVDEMLPDVTLPKGTTSDGHKLQPRVAEALLEFPHYAEAVRAIDVAKKAVRRLGELKSARFLRVQDVVADLDNARRGVKFAAPHGPCPYCAQAGCAGDKACRKAGWLPHGMYTEAKRAMESGA